MTLKLHHIEFCVANAIPVIELLVRQYGFKKVGHRTSQTCVQTVLQSGKTVFLITSRKSETKDEQSNENEPFTYFCCTGFDRHTIDSAFNISIQVDNLSDTVNQLQKNLDNLIMLSPMKIVDTNGQGVVKYCIIKSICGNLIHTLIEKSQNYAGWFLPGFIQESDLQIQTEDNASNDIFTTHLDHLAIACREGETDKIIEWYKNGFGMKRFMSNRQESVENGLEIGGDVGMRLKVMEFWKCSELGVCSGDPASDDSMKIVIAESLPNIKNAQIEGYLKNHGTSGLQHVGLYTNNMLDAVGEMVKRGAEFRHPPPTYYTEIGQLEAIRSVNENVEVLKKYGILLDTEADADSEVTEKHSSSSRYLMQIFTNSIFTNDTFILEVIERKGASGFGIGNISALTRSIIAFNKMQHSDSIKNSSMQG